MILSSCFWIFFIPDLLAQPFFNSSLFMNIPTSNRQFGHLYPFGIDAHDIDLSDRPWKERQIDLDFQFPYYGFRFNYTFIYPEGFLAFGTPLYIQPPYSFPNTRWPQQPDPSVISVFMSEQSFVFVGEKKISNVWYRLVHRPGQDLGFREEDISAIRPPFIPHEHRPRILPGRVEDSPLLNEISRDIKEGMVGTRGFVADFCLIVTWERMGHGGMARYLQLDRFQEVLKWQNTYQVVLATDEIRSFVMLNYGNINWTSSASAGAPSGRGGRQSALVGFNGGNGTGFVELPYSAGGYSFGLTMYGSANVAGRWLARVDEEIVFGGCLNDSTGKASTEIDTVSMMGGHAINISGPCFRQTDLIRLQIEEFVVDCQRINMVKAYCVLPPDVLFRAGYYPIGLSTNGGQTYQWWDHVLVASPDRTPLSLRLINDPIDMHNQWRSSTADNLTIRWSAANITSLTKANIDINLWGYWEDVSGHEFRQVVTLAKDLPNSGFYSFNPRILHKGHVFNDSEWRKFDGGVVQVRLSSFRGDFGEGGYWSELLPFNWYMRELWEEKDGEEWALKRCIEWFEYDGQRENFGPDVEVDFSCPCTMAQALADFGRFVNFPTCDIEGNMQCNYVEGAALCVVSTSMSTIGAAQMCCYDDFGFLMLSQDYEYTTHYLRFFGAGFPYRAHPWGMYPYRRPPFVPGLSNFYNDLLPYEICCQWAEHCEFFYWRRRSNGCQGYSPPSLGFAYGHGHFRTFDGLEYTFNGKGFFVLTQLSRPNYNLMVQIRMEKPEPSTAQTIIKTTVISGLAVQENDSASVQVFARKTYRRWRYKLDVYIDGMRVFFDKYHKKLQFFQGVTLRSPTLNMDMSEIEIMFRSGVGVKIREILGSLQVTLAIPYSYKTENPSNEDSCLDSPLTYGLLGIHGMNQPNHLINAHCQKIQLSATLSQPEVSKRLHHTFGETWRVGLAKQELLFDVRHRALNDPIDFALTNHTPTFDPLNDSHYELWRSFIGHDLHLVCQDSQACLFDYVASGHREYAREIAKLEATYNEAHKTVSTKLISCGSLEKAPNVLKTPLGGNYLDGSVVTMSCKPDYLPHGTTVRQCINGTWSPGWHVWCRSRKEEIALRWITGLISIFCFLTAISVFFVYLYKLRVTRQLVWLSEVPRSVF